MSQESQRSECSQHSQNFKHFQVTVDKSHIEYGCTYNEEIHLIPCVTKIRSFIHAQPHSNKLGGHFDDEQVVECIIQIPRDPVSSVDHFRIDEECIIEQFDGTQRDQDNDDALPGAMLDSFISVDSHAAVFGENVERRFTGDTDEQFLVLDLMFVLFNDLHILEQLNNLFLVKIF
jgi:hypothetical protein